MRSSPHTDSVRVLMTGGGTGGHVYPAIAIADAIRELRPHARVAFAGSRDRMEWDAVPRAGYPIHEVAVQGLCRSFSAANLKLPLILAKGFRQARDVVEGTGAQVVVGTGGYVALPVLLAAWSLNAAILIQEQSAYLGLTNRVASRFADRIHVAFAEAADALLPRPSQVSGNPVRSGLTEVTARGREAAREKLGMSAMRRVVFVFGGSLGSSALNDAMQSALPHLMADPDLGILWQTGVTRYDAVRAALDGEAGTPAGASLREDATSGRIQIVPYVDDMATAYAAADLVVARSGALTCSELLVTGRPSLLIPSPNVTADHQAKNAHSMERMGASEVLSETELEASLSGTLLHLLGSQAALDAMSRAALAAARPRAAHTIAMDVIAMAEGEA